MKRCFAALLVMVFCTTFRPAAAENSQLPLVLLLQHDMSDNPTYSEEYISGDLWKWDGGSSLQQITNWGYDLPPILSPDGRRMVFQSLPQITIDYLNSDASHAVGVDPDATPLNMWLMDTQSGQATRIADQSPSAYIDAPHFDLVGGTTRSMPAWSPDGQKIAWIEADSSAAMDPSASGKFDANLMVYDLTTRQTTITIPHLKLPDYQSPGFTGIGMGKISLRWSKAGLTMGYINSSSDQYAFVTIDESGGLVSEITTDLVIMDGIPSFNLVDWVKNGKQIDFGIGTTDPYQWSLFDSATGKGVSLDGVVEAYNALAPKGGALRANSENTWEFGSASQPVVQIENCYTDDLAFAISPDGQSFACHDGINEAIAIYNASGQVASIPLNNKVLLSMAWGKLAWRVVPAGS